MAWLELNLCLALPSLCLAVLEWTCLLPSALILGYNNNLSTMSQRSHQYIPLGSSLEVPLTDTGTVSSDWPEYCQSNPHVSVAFTLLTQLSIRPHRESPNFLTVQTLYSPCIMT